MPNKKINQLTPRTPTLTDLILVGDPATGYSYKATLSAMVNFVGGNIQFSSLGGISLTNPTNGQVLTFNGTNWVNQTPASAPVSSVFGRTGAVVAAEGDYSLTQLSDVTISSPTNGQVLKYNGTAWVNDSDTDTGITSLNGLTANTQTFATGTSGTDFNISSTTSTHTFNLPTASATNRGALSSSDWSTFNAKQSTITLTTTGSSGAATFVSNTLNVPNYTLAGLGGVSGSGTTNYVPKWTGSSALGNSQIFDNGTSVGIGTATPSASYKLDVSGPTKIVNDGTLGGEALNLTTTGSTVIMGINFSTGSSGLILGNSTALYVRGVASRDLNLGSNNTNDRMIIKSGGNVLIGTSTDAGFRLDVSGTFRSTLDARINGLTVGKGGGSVVTNTAVGVEAINATATGTNNVALGYRTLRSVTSGGFNVGIGANSGGDGTSTLFSLTTGNYNIGIGAGALRLVTTTIGNVALGYLAGEVTTAQYGTFNGYAAGYQVTTGEYNTIVGGLSGWGITTGSNNTIIGARVQGLSSSLANTIILADGQGNQRLYINNSGNVGIGTTSPAARLDVSASNNEIRSTGTSSTYTQYNAFIPSGVNMRIGAFATNNGFLGTTTNHPFNIETNNTQRARFFANGNLLIGSGTTDSGYLLDVSGTARVTTSAYFATASGSVGIGTTSPSSKLHVQNGALTSTVTWNAADGVIISGTNFGGLQLQSPSGSGEGFIGFSSSSVRNFGFILYSNSTHRMSFATSTDGASSGTTKMQITQTGRLLLGTTTESTFLLDVNGSLRSTTSQFDNSAQVGKADNTSSYPTLGLRYASGSGADIQGYQGGSVSVKIRMQATNLYINTPGNMIFCNAVNETNESMRIVTSTKNVLIGTTTDAGQKLQVNGTALFNGAISVYSIVKNGADQGNPLQLYKAYNQTNAIIEFYGGIGAALQYSTNTRKLFPSITGGIDIGTSALQFGSIYSNNAYFSTVVGIGTTSPSNELHVVTGNVDGIRVESSGSGYLETGKTGGGRYRWSNDYTGANMLELQYGAAGATPTTTRMSVFSNGNINVGTNIDQGYNFFVNGTTLIGGTELRLNNATTGVINLYSNTPEIRFASADPTNYRFYRSGTTMYWNSAGNIRLQIAGNEAYQIDAANGHIWRTALSGGASLARLDTGGSLSIGKGSTAAVASSIVELSSTTKGFLPPRMTTTQKNAITSPAAGLVVYDTTLNKLCVYTTAWEIITSI